jgi:hypothetical protein
VEAVVMPEQEEMLVLRSVALVSILAATQS